MNKSDLVDAIAREQGISKRQAGDVLDSVMKNIVGSVKKGDEVRLVGFGTFYRAKRKARTGINPRTKQKMQIPAKNVPKFRPSADFKKNVE